MALTPPVNLPFWGKTPPPKVPLNGNGAGMLVEEVLNTEKTTAETSFSCRKIWIIEKNFVPLPLHLEMLWRVKAATQHNSSELGSAFALRFTCQRERHNRSKCVAAIINTP